MNSLLSTRARFGYLTAVVAACAAATVSASTFGVVAHVPKEAVADEVVEAANDTELHYRWRRNSVELTDNEQIEGSDSPRLTVPGRYFLYCLP